MFLYGPWALLGQASAVSREQAGVPPPVPVPLYPSASVYLASCLSLLPKAHAGYCLHVGDSAVGNCRAPSSGISTRQLVT